MSVKYYVCSECDSTNEGDGPCPVCQARSSLAAPAGSAHDRRDSRIHPSHKMSAWRSTIISTANSDRFGELRECLNCGAEQASTVTGSHSHDELRKPCPSVPNEKVSASGDENQKPL
jgi:hypothetical protein